MLNWQVESADDKTRPGLRLSFTAQVVPLARVARLRLSLT